jgi:hypothetical protein
MKSKLGPIAVVVILLLSLANLGQSYINRVQGMAAHDAAAAGFPVIMGGKAASGTPAAVAAGDAVNAYFDQNGRLVVSLGTAFDASVDTFGPGANASVAALLTHRFAANGTNALLVATSQTVKASAGRVYGYEVRNVNANVMFIHFYDTGSTVTVGTTVPIVSVAVPGGSGTAPGVARVMFSISIAFGSAIKIAASTSDDHTVATAPGTGLSGIIYYK